MPNVLVEGQSIGGGSEVAGLHERGELMGKLRELGGTRVKVVERLEERLEEKGEGMGGGLGGREEAVAESRG